jgi:hypothetical protein
MICAKDPSGVRSGHWLTDGTLETVSKIHTVFANSGEAGAGARAEGVSERIQSNPQTKGSYEHKLSND